MSAKQKLVEAIAEQNFRADPSLADKHLANAVEALIDERVRRFANVHASVLTDAERADIADSFREMRAEISRLE